MKSDVKKWMKGKGMLLILLLLPIAVLILWFVSHKSETLKATATGLNALLPQPLLKKADSSKLSFYEQGEKSDDVSMDSFLENNLIEKARKDSALLNIKWNYDPLLQQYADSNEANAYQKIERLEKAIAAPLSGPAKRFVAMNEDRGAPLLGDVDSLERLLHVTSEKKEGDPELEALNSMMEKILDIQHPQRVKEREKSHSVNEHVPEIEQGSVSVSLLVAHKDYEFKEFGREGRERSEKEPLMIAAFIDGDQSIRNGSLVKIRLAKSFTINGDFLGAGSVVYAKAMLKDDRLHLEVRSILIHDRIIKIGLEAFDLDGLPGINVPVAQRREVVKPSIDEGIQTIKIPGLDNSLKTEAARFSLNTARRFLSGNKKATKVFVKGGYRLILHPNS